MNTPTRPFVLAAVLVLCVMPAFGWSATVFVAQGGSVENDARVKAALESFGHSVTIGPHFSNLASPISFDAYNTVIVLGCPTYLGEMSAEVQASLKAYVAAGGGLITGEWTMWSYRFWTSQILQEALPATNAGGYRSLGTGGQITYAQATPDPVLNAGLSSSFTFTATDMGGSESLLTPKGGSTVFYGTDYDSAAAGVTGWQFGAGRVISFSTPIAEDELADTEYRRLLSNAVTWTTVPEPSAITLFATGIAALAACIWRRRKSPSLRSNRY